MTRLWQNQVTAARAALALAAARAAHESRLFPHRICQQHCQNMKTGKSQFFLNFYEFDEFVRFGVLYSCQSSFYEQKRLSCDSVCHKFIKPVKILSLPSRTCRIT